MKEQLHKISASKNFWQKLPKPFFILAPMANVTDAAFRKIIAAYGKPDVFYTEFVAADGLVSSGREILLNDLKFGEGEHPIVAQLFGSNLEKMEKASALVESLGFDGLDINMGCPDRTIEKQGAGAAMIKNPKHAKEIIAAARCGAPSLPISVKTRVGFNTREIETWIPALLSENLAALTVHARTRKEMSKVPARWEDVKRIVELKDQIAPNTLIIGNGDVKNLEEARQKIKETSADGVMIGRGIFGNPWLFAEKIPTLEDRLRVMVEHTKLFEEYFAHIKSFATMKKHYKAYVEGFPGAKELRNELMETKNALEVKQIVNAFLSSRNKAEIDIDFPSLK
jgi:nifR3 family TIM-barrel protein